MNKLVVFGTMAALSISLGFVGFLAQPKDETNAVNDYALDVADQPFSAACRGALNSFGKDDHRGCECVATELTKVIAETDNAVAATAVKLIMSRHDNDYDEMDIYSDLNKVQRLHELDIDKSMAVMTSVNEAVGTCVTRIDYFTAAIKTRLTRSVDNQTQAMAALVAGREQPATRTAQTEQTRRPRRQRPQSASRNSRPTNASLSKGNDQSRSLELGPNDGSEPNSTVQMSD